MSGKVIKLNVGGTLFTTTVATLTKYPDSMLAIMFNPESERPPAEKDDHGNFFLDCNPRAFEYILEFLRRGKLPEEIAGCGIEQVEWEADYFGLQELLDIIGKRKDKEEREKVKKEVLECEEKAAEMYGKSANALRMFSACDSDICDIETWKDLPDAKACFSCNQLSRSGKIYERMAREFEAKAADLGRKRKHSEI